MVNTPRRSFMVAGLFILWLGLLSGAYWYFFIKPKHWFDPMMVQPPALYDEAAQVRLRALLQKNFPQLQSGKTWFVRLEQNGCSCERFVELYHKSYAAQANDAMQVVSLNLSELTLPLTDRHALLSWVTATPAIALFDPQGQLSYFGPYHQDGVCNSENSYLEPILAKLAKGDAISVVNTLVYGCFCPTQQ